jgi:hypothetical protein
MIRQKTCCKARTKNGEPCRAAATAGGLCFFHGNPNKAKELGRKGGRRKRHMHPDSVEPLPKLESAKAVRETVARLIDEVYSGTTHPSVAGGIVPLLNLGLRAIDSADVQEQLERLNKRCAELEGRSGGSDSNGLEPIP